MGAYFTPLLLPSCLTFSKPANQCSRLSKPLTHWFGGLEIFLLGLVGGLCVMGCASWIIQNIDFTLKNSYCNVHLNYFNPTLKVNWSAFFITGLVEENRLTSFKENDANNILLNPNCSVDISYIFSLQVYLLVIILKYADPVIVCKQTTNWM